MEDHRETTDHTVQFARRHTVEDRLLRAEWRIDDHDKIIDDLKREAHLVGKELRLIQSTLQQIKYFAMGAVALYFANSMGLGEALKIIGM